MRKNDFVYLRHILDAISRIEEYTHGIRYEDFMDNYLIQDGVIRQIEIIGEATKRLSKEIRWKGSIHRGVFYLTNKGSIHRGVF
jgi:uncharacterized protein with HEPN domain